MLYTKINVNLVIIIFIINIILLSIVFAIDLKTKETLDIDLSKYIYHTNKLIYEKDYMYANYSNNTKGSIIYLYKLYKAKGTLLVYINPSQNRIGTNILEEIKVPNLSKINDKNEILIFSTAGGNKIFYIPTTGKKHIQENPSYPLSYIKSTEDVFYWLGYNYVDKTKEEIDKIYLFTYNNYQIQKFDLEGIINVYDVIDLEIIDKNTIFLVKKDKNKQSLIKISNGKPEYIYTSELILLSKNKIHKSIYFLSKENSKFFIKTYDLQNRNVNNFYDLTRKYNINSPLLFSVFKDKFNDFYKINIFVSTNQRYLVELKKLLPNQEDDKKENVNIETSVEPFIINYTPLQIAYPAKYRVIIDTFK